MSDTTRDDGTSSEDDDSRDGHYVDPTAPPPYPQEYGTPGPPPPPSGAPYGTPDPSPTSPYAAPGQEGPAAPEGAGSPYGSGPYGAPPPGGAPSGGTPYGGAPYGGAPYGSPDSPYGTPPPAYYQSAAPQSNTSALVLTIVSAIGTLSCCLPLPALILGIMALTKQTNEPEQSAKLAKYGWITFGAMVALAVVAVIAFMGFAVLSAPTTTTDF